MATGRMIRVLLVEDHTFVRNSLRSFLESYPDIHVVGEAATGEEALVSVERLQPAVVVMDINLPTIDGITTTRQIRSQYAQVAVVGLTIASEESIWHSMEKAGAFGVLTKDEDAVEGLYQAIKEAARSVAPSSFYGNADNITQPSSPTKTPDCLQQ
jgi:DNA-binding NarL/FixJ family response regulator